MPCARPYGGHASEDLRDPLAGRVLRRVGHPLVARRVVRPGRPLSKRPRPYPAPLARLRRPVKSIGSPTSSTRLDRNRSRSGCTRRKWRRCSTGLGCWSEWVRASPRAAPGSSDPGPSPGEDAPGASRGRGWIGGPNGRALSTRAPPAPGSVCFTDALGERPAKATGLLRLATRRNLDCTGFGQSAERIRPCQRILSALTTGG